MEQVKRALMALWYAYSVAVLGAMAVAALTAMFSYLGWYQ